MIVTLPNVTAALNVPCRPLGTAGTASGRLAVGRGGQQVWYGEQVQVTGTGHRYPQVPAGTVPTLVHSKTLAREGNMALIFENNVEFEKLSFSVCRSNV